MPDISEQRRSIIDEWCDRFEAEWKSAAQPRLAEYLQQWTGPGQEELFRFLLELDVDYRRRSGADASVVPYYYDRSNLLFGTKVKNVINDPNHGMPVLDAIWVEQ